MLSPTIEQMKSSYLGLGFAQDSEDVSNFGTNQFNRMPTHTDAYLHNYINTKDSKVIEGNRPCARDGHRMIILGGSFLIFGGDRHRMCFND
jgi:hypothetical protein